jgi:hypothetical protein
MEISEEKLEQEMRGKLGRMGFEPEQVQEAITEAKSASATNKLKFALNYLMCLEEKEPSAPRAVVCNTWC